MEITFERVLQPDRECACKGCIFYKPLHNIGEKKRCAVIEIDELECAPKNDKNNYIFKLKSEG